MLSRFNFLYHHVSTFLPYDEETMYSREETSSSQFNLEAIQHVLASQTKTQRQILKVLVNSQLNDGKSRNEVGITETEFLDALSNETIALTHQSLQNQIVDFLEHNIIKKKFSGQRGNLYFVPHSDEVIESEILPLLEG
jgi:hypothetical protein